MKLKEVRKITDGRKVMQFTGNTPYTIVGHSCLLPSFSISMKAGALREYINTLGDEEILTVTVSEGKPAEFTVVK